MKAEFIQYIEDISEPVAIRSRVEELLVLYNDVFIEEIQDIFIEETIDPNGDKQYKSLHLLSESFDHEIANFLFQDKLFIVPIKNNFDTVKFEKESFNFSAADSNSKLIIKCSLSGGNLSVVFYATKRNCNYLLKIFKKYISKNFYL